MEPRRITREQMFMDIVHTIAKRGTCGRLQVGALIVLDGRIISMGYNGSARGEQHCNVACDINKPCTRAIHAEANAIYFAAQNGIAIKGATLYSTDSPCMTCAEAIIQSGIEYVIYQRDFRDTRPNKRLTDNGIVIKIYEGN